MTERVFKFKNVDFGDGKRSCTLKFKVGQYTAWALVQIETEQGNKTIAKAALANCTGVADTTSFVIDHTSGVHDVVVTVDENADIIDISFSDEYPIYPDTASSRKTLKADAFGADSWEAVDMLGRRIPSVEDVGAKNDRKVGIFYWTWHERVAHQEPVSLTEVFGKYPDAEYNADHPAWGGGRPCCHWNEPLFGFYRDSDAYVVRRHAVMLAAAGVDFMMFDCTNGAFLWRDAYEPVLAELQRCLDDGINVPKIGFILNFGPIESSVRMLYALYQDLYRCGKYRDLWYMHNGKPLIMAFSECLPEKGACESDDLMIREMKEFFTFRPPQPLYQMSETSYHHKDHWGWLEIAPQSKYCQRDDGSCEMMTVGVAQNANSERICTCFNDKGTFGRSYTHKYGHALVSEESYKYGYNFQEQWDRACDAAPDAVFVTGWNEWLVGMSLGEPWITDKDSKKVAFVDQYDREHSRDIEPDKDGYLDTYYLQLAANIRRFKGAYPRVLNTREKTIDIKGGFSQWKDVVPFYKNPKGLAAKRDCRGFGSRYYKNDTGRNEIIGAKACRDDEYMYFYVECADDLSKPDGDGWMTLFINSDRTENGWNGFDFVINRACPKNGKATVERYVSTADENSFTWEKIGTCDIKYRKNKLMLKIPCEMINVKKTCESSTDIEFKWSDNIVSGDIMDFYLDGCSAPYGRFNYRFKN